MQGPGKAVEVPMLNPFCRQLADQAVSALRARPAASEEARCLLSAFGAISMKYQDVRPPLPFSNLHFYTRCPTSSRSTP